MSLARALQLHGEGRLDDARQLYLSLLEGQPDDPAALHYLGILEHQCGRSDEGLALLTRAMELAPRAERLNDLGNVLSQLDRLTDAEAAFTAATRLGPDEPDHHNNLGSVLVRQDRLPEAEAAFRRALACNGDFIPAWSNLGELCTRLGRSVEAARYHCEAFVRGPLEGKPKRMLGIAYYTLDRIPEAAEVYRQWCAEEPDNPIARHMLAACSGDAVPGRAEDGFVEAIFDEYAASFDSKLVHNLGYRGPEYIAAALAAHLSPSGTLRVLDAGCGTGLCGPVLAPYAAHLTGVDLSANMLERARARGGYAQLVKAELGEYLAGNPRAFELIVCADVLIYFGALEGVLAAAHRALEERGLLVFTLETHTSEVPFVIRPSGRYSHAPGYLERTLVDHGFEIASSTPVVLREELTVPVAGLVVSARRR